MNREQTLNHAKEAAYHLSLAVNSFDAGEAGEEIVRGILNDHRCIQQAIFDAVIIPLVREMGNRFDADRGVDPRNYMAAKWCATVCQELDRLEAQRKAERECRANAQECGGF